MSLKEYHRKRNFSETPEPKGNQGESSASGPLHGLRFVVQKHSATRLHFDFRIECDGVLMSWAVPRGPSLNPNDQRLAVRVEDHPLEYGRFEGIIPKSNYGAGTVMLWDMGFFLERTSRTREESEERVRDGYAKGHITMLLRGHKIAGEFALIKLQKDSPDKNWLLLKKRDEYSEYKPYQPDDISIASGRSIALISAAAETAGQIWLPGKGPQDGEQLFDPAQITKPLLQPKNVKTGGAPAVAAPEGLAVADAPEERTPHNVKPMVATVFRPGIFDDDDWLFFPYNKGIRAIGESGKAAKLYSKTGRSFNTKYPDITAALRGLPPSLVIDGEICAVDNDGRIHPEATRKPQAELQEASLSHRYFVHDILHRQGKNLRVLACEQRQQMLTEVRFDGHAIARLTSQLGEGTNSLKLALEQGCPGVIGKHRLSPYQSGTSKYWVRIEQKKGSGDPPPLLTNLDKVMFRKDRLTKGDLVEYYRRIAPLMLPHLRERPQSLNRHPHGIDGQSFYQKDLTGYVPDWMATEPIFSPSAGKTIAYPVCQNQNSLLYLANLGCIELHPWISRRPHLDQPDYSVIDLDPDGHSYDEVVKTALEVHSVLQAIGVPHYAKTSGSTGMHICVPLGAKYSYETSREFARAVCTVVHQRLPELTSLERSPNLRRGKIYLDFMQNRRGQTLAAPYCIRPREGAPVSTPLAWEEVTLGLEPSHFHMHNIFDRIDRVGDLWLGVIGEGIDLQSAEEKLERL